MKTIDLNKYYQNPELYEESNMVDVPDEVADVMEQSLRDEKTAYMRSYRAKAYYSLDYGNGIENYVVFHEETPEEIYERKMTMQQLNQALSRRQCCKRKMKKIKWRWLMKQTPISAPKRHCQKLK